MPWPRPPPPPPRSTAPAPDRTEESLCPKWRYAFNLGASSTWKILANPAPGPYCHPGLAHPVPPASGRAEVFFCPNSALCFQFGGAEHMENFGKTPTHYQIYSWDATRCQQAPQLPRRKPANHPDWRPTEWPGTPRPPNSVGESPPGGAGTALRSGRGGEGGLGAEGGGRRVMVLLGCGRRFRCLGCAKGRLSRPAPGVGMRPAGGSRRRVGAAWSCGGRFAVGLGGPRMLEKVGFFAGGGRGAGARCAGFRFGRVGEGSGRAVWR